jgi:hypothetical protein
MSLTSYRAAPPRVISAFCVAECRIISVFGEAEDRAEDTALAVFVDSANRRFVAYGLGRMPVPLFILSKLPKAICLL